MLDGGNLHVPALQRRPHHGVADVLSTRLDVRGLAEIDASKQYPYQYICFRITEFRPDSYPDMLIENVSGGGNRLDLGMLRYTDVAWMDDRTAPSVHVRHNVEGLSAVFPPAYLLSFLTDHEGEPLHDSPDISLYVRSRMAGGRLQILVEDDGVGIPEPKLATLFEQGIGVSNVNERLKVLFGDDYKMWIDSHLGEGTSTGIELPEQVSGTVVRVESLAVSS